MSGLTANCVGWFFVLLGSAFLFWGNMDLKIGLEKRLYPKGNKQDLVTECQVKDMIKHELPNKYDGYIYHKGGRVNVNIVGVIDKKIKIRFPIGYCEYDLRTDFVLKLEREYPEYGIVGEQVDYGYKWYLEKWIPKKDFHKYYTTEELSEIINKKGKR